MQRTKRKRHDAEETPQKAVVHRIFCLARIMREKADSLEEAEEALRWERLAKTRQEKLSGIPKEVSTPASQTTLPIYEH